MTVLEAIQRSADFLSKKGVESPRLQVELLLADLLHLPRMQLYLNFERALTPAETDTLRERVRRRGQREPLQHITGSISFCGLEIAVTRDVLTPRPETELLAEFGWEFLNSVAASGNGSGTLHTTPHALDFGTGSGCLAIALAVKCLAAHVVGIDISEGAIAVARDNAKRHGLESRIKFLAGDGFAALPPDCRFDLIISNPPYIATAEIATLEPEVRDHDPRTALDGGADGLDFYRRFAREAEAFLNPSGRIMVEFGDSQGPAVQTIFEQQKWIVEAVKADYTDRMRILIARRADQ